MKPTHPHSAQMQCHHPSLLSTPHSQHQAPDKPTAHHLRQSNSSFPTPKGLSLLRDAISSKYLKQARTPGTAVALITEKKIFEVSRSSHRQSLLPRTRQTSRLSGSKDSERRSPTPPEPPHRKAIS